jgi:hypothetical protein
MTYVNFAVYLDPCSLTSFTFTNHLMFVTELFIASTPWMQGIQGVLMGINHRESVNIVRSFN